jgi:SAM-dependent methyltransferase
VHGHANRSRVSFYGGDLARVHDEGFGDFARAAARELLVRVPSQGTVVELGCGSGIGAQILSDAGWEVIGIDLSADMLAIAARRAPGARFVQRSIWDVELPPCDAVTAIGEVVNYAADPRAAADRLPDLFGRIERALARGGLFMFDFATPGRGEVGAGPGTRQGEGWRIRHEAVEDPERELLERRISMRVGGRESRETHVLRLYEPGHVREQLTAAGFRAEALDGYDDFRFWPGYAGFAASAPGR